MFGEKGYHGASVTEITRAAGVAQGTFYLYFRGKKEIFLDLVDSLGKRLRELTLAARPPGGTYADAQAQGFRAFFELAHNHRAIYRIIQECDRVDPLTYRRFYTSLADAYARGAEDAIQKGEIDAIDPEVLAYAILGIGHFVALRYLIWDDDYTDKTAESVAHLVERGLRGVSPSA